MYKYNNQDHSMITALYGVRNICGANYDLCAVNTEPDYHKERRHKQSVGNAVTDRTVLGLSCLHCAHVQQTTAEQSEMWARRIPSCG